MPASTNPDHFVRGPPSRSAVTIRSSPTAASMWENLSHGQYLNDDAVDMHGVLRPAAGDPARFRHRPRRAMFHAPTAAIIGGIIGLEALNAKATSTAATSTKCRAIRASCSSPPARIFK